MGEGWVDLESVLLAGFPISKFLLDTANVVVVVAKFCEYNGTACFKKHK